VGKKPWRLLICFNEIFRGPFFSSSAVTSTWLRVSAAAAARFDGFGSILKKKSLGADPTENLPLLNWPIYQSLCDRVSLLLQTWCQHKQRCNLWRFPEPALPTYITYMRSVSKNRFFVGGSSRQLFNYIEVRWRGFAAASGWRETPIKGRKKTRWRKNLCSRRQQQLGKRAD
jgi:hypothetical protein